MTLPIEDHTFGFEGGHTHYIAAGPENGPLIILIHGWIAVAETWKPQIIALSSLGFRVVAPDTRGYGGSTVTNDVRDYRLERHVADMLALLEHLGREQAVWIGHDWGCGLVSSFASHYPEKCVAVSCMTVPYRTVELGMDALVATVDRNIYPVDEFPLGQWDYIAFHIDSPKRSAATLDRDPRNTIKNLYRKSSAAQYGKVGWTASLRKVGGWWGSADSAPEVDIKNTMLENEPEIYEKLCDTIKNNGTQGPNAYYLNHDVNYKYSQNLPNEGVLTMPVLFIGAKWDQVCDSSVSGLSEQMRKFCTSLTEVEIDAGHWVAFDKPCETNAAIVKWLVTKVQAYWPGY
ncbi:Alpha/Beta hydrolase protein [Bisporella sp. PMI_857]|nr:Alpha/Beta hydrolase protein [Bisporella sp. PMI_857]